ncbi:MAG: hypothetical protein WCW01_02485 [Gammaproteobacteria bacterium]
MLYHTQASSTSSTSATTITTRPLGNAGINADLRHAPAAPVHENAIAIQRAIDIQEFIAGSLIGAYQNPPVPAPALAPVSAPAPGAVHEEITEEEEEEEENASTPAQKFLTALDHLSTPPMTGTSTTIKSFFDLAQGIDLQSSSGGSSSSGSSSSSSSSTASPTRGTKLAAVRNHPNYSIIELFLKVAQAEWQRQHSLGYRKVTGDTNFANNQVRQAIVGAFAVYNMTLEEPRHRWENFPVGFKKKIFLGSDMFLASIFESESFPRVDQTKVERLIQVDTQEQNKKVAPMPAPPARQNEFVRTNYGGTNNDRLNEVRPLLQHADNTGSLGTPKGFWQKLGAKAVAISGNPDAWIALLLVFIAGISGSRLKATWEENEHSKNDLIRDDLKDILCAKEDLPKISVLMKNLPKTAKTVVDMVNFAREHGFGVNEKGESCVTAWLIGDGLKPIVQSCRNVRQAAITAQEIAFGIPGGENVNMPGKGSFALPAFLFSATGIMILFSSIGNYLRLKNEAVSKDHPESNCCLAVKSFLMALQQGGGAQLLTMGLEGLMAVASSVVFEDAIKEGAKLFGQFITPVLDENCSSSTGGCAFGKLVECANHEGMVTKLGDWLVGGANLVGGLLAIYLVGKGGYYLYKRHKDRSHSEPNAERQAEEGRTNAATLMLTRVVTSPLSRGAQGGTGTPAPALSSGAHATTTPVAPATPAPPLPSITLMLSSARASGAQRPAPPVRPAPSIPVSNTANPSSSSSATSASHQSPDTASLTSLIGIVGGVARERATSSSSSSSSTFPTASATPPSPPLPPPSSPQPVPHPNSVHPGALPASASSIAALSASSSITTGGDDANVDRHQLDIQNSARLTREIMAAGETLAASISTPMTASGAASASGGSSTPSFLPGNTGPRLSSSPHSLFAAPPSPAPSAASATTTATPVTTPTTPAPAAPIAPAPRST